MIMTFGWRRTVPVKMFLGRAELLGKVRPWAKTATQSAGLAAAADFAAQWFAGPKQVERNFTTQAYSTQDIDMRRVSSFGVFGFVYSGFVQRLIYRKFDMAFGITSAVATVSKKVVADTLLHAPFLYIPAFFLSTGLLQGKSLHDSINCLRTNFKDTMMTYAVIWPGAMFLLFRAVPESSRVLTLACLSFVEKLIYSSIELFKHTNVSDDMSSKTEIPEDVSEACVQSFASVGGQVIPMYSGTKLFKHTSVMDDMSSETKIPEDDIEAFVQSFACVGGHIIPIRL